MQRAMLIALLICGVTGCDAGFTDLDSESADLNPDSGAPGANAQTGDAQTGDTLTIARGTFEGRAGHAGRGGVALVRHQESGDLELRFEDDFVVSGVSAPIALLSSRDSIGRTLDRDLDLNLGRLTSTRGTQSYAVPRDDDALTVAWVYCEPFAVEVARAVLTRVE